MDGGEWSIYIYVYSFVVIVSCEMLDNGEYKGY